MYVDNRVARGRSIRGLHSEGRSQWRFTLCWMDLMKRDICFDLKVVKIGQMEPKLGSVQCCVALGTGAWR